MPVIGFLDATSAAGAEGRVRSFREGLKESGYLAGENVAIVPRWAEGQADLPPVLAADLIRQHVAVLATIGNTAALAAKSATTTVPTVFAVGEDPVRLGLVATLARPGGNLTGINFFVGEVAAKRLELLRELVPGAVRVAVLVNPTNPNRETTSKRGQVSRLRWQRWPLSPRENRGAKAAAPRPLCWSAAPVPNTPSARRHA